MFDPAVDTAAATWALLARTPGRHRVVVSMLLDLPPDYPVLPVSDPCTAPGCGDGDLCDEDHPVTGHVIAGALLDYLNRGKVDPDELAEAIHNVGMTRPGRLGEVA